MSRLYVLIGSSKLGGWGSSCFKQRDLFYLKESFDSFGSWVRCTIIQKELFFWQYRVDIKMKDRFPLPVLVALYWHSGICDTFSIERYYAWLKASKPDSILPFYSLFGLQFARCILQLQCEKTILNIYAILLIYKFRCIWEQIYMFWKFAFSVKACYNLFVLAVL